MFEDTLRVLPYALGVAATPQLVRAIRSTHREGDAHRALFGLVAGWSVALVFLTLVSLQVDLDGSRSAPVGGTLIIGAGLVAVLAASGHRASIDPAAFGRDARVSTTSWIWRGIGGVVLDLKNVALTLAAGVSFDNTGGVARAELRLVGTLLAFVSIGLFVSATRGPGRPLPSSTVGAHRRARISNTPTLLVAGLAVAVDGVLIAVGK